MSSAPLPHVLVVLDAPPEEPGPLPFLHAWLADLLNDARSSYRVSLFYPVHASMGPFYRLHREEKNGIERFFSFVPYRCASFRETFSNPAMDALFAAIIKEGAFSVTHIVSLRNHSLGYPAIAYHAGLPVVLTVSDGWLLHPLCRVGREKNPNAFGVKLSNFVATPFSLVIKTFEERFARQPRRWWFEEVGRYSLFYNKTSPSGAVDPEVLEERERLVTEMIPHVGTFHFFSQGLYDNFYAATVPADRVVFMPQGIPVAKAVNSRPFEIQRGLSFGFIGDLIPEEGVVELVEAFNELHERGIPSALHLYGETFGNDDFVRYLKSRCRTPEVRFHGAIDTRRIGPVLDILDGIVITSLWPYPETWLALQAMARRKVVVASPHTAAAELVRKTRRGIVLKAVDAGEIAQTISELEIDRKRVYYLMRLVEDGHLVSSSSNARDLSALYEKVSPKREPRDAETTLSRRLMRKRAARSRRKS